VDLEDLNHLGQKFTLYHSNGETMSRIDRALISEDWENTWGTPSLWFLPRDVSDYCPLILKVGVTDWGPKPFRFNNHWIENRNFKKVVEDLWVLQGEVAWMGVVLKNKLKKLKGGLREWNKGVWMLGC